MGLLEAVVRHPVAGYEGLYEVAEDGRVIASPRPGRGYRRYERVLRPHRKKDGHWNVGLTKDGRQKKHHVHRIVAEAFIPNPQNLPVVNHIDGNPSNNHRSNLEWCTVSHNVHHAYDSGLRDAQRETLRRLRAKLTATQVKEIRRRYAEGSDTIMTLGSEFGVHYTTIWNVVSGKFYQEVP